MVVVCCLLRVLCRSERVSEVTSPVLSPDHPSHVSSTSIASRRHQHHDTNTNGVSAWHLSPAAHNGGSHASDPRNTASSVVEPFERDVSSAPSPQHKGKEPHSRLRIVYKVLSKMWFDQSVAIRGKLRWPIAMRALISRVSVRWLSAACMCLMAAVTVVGLLVSGGVALSPFLSRLASAAGGPPWQRLGAASGRLAVVIPFVNDDVPRIIDGVQQWAELGPVCDLQLASSQPKQRPALFFLHSTTRAVYEGSNHRPELSELIDSSEAVARLVLPCFERVETIFAELTAAEDGYPEGPSNMFFKLMLQLAPRLLQPYSHIYWMEWDVKPVRAVWLDALRFITSGEEFWMKGGRYRGRAFDDVVLADPKAWSWIGHLNGNALYKLHSAAFNRFLELVVEREPPSHFWKPFDIAIWKTLYDLPYSWHLYQIYGGMFQTTGVIQHMGFTVQPRELQLLIAASPVVYLVHGDGKSAGTYKYERKFKAGVAQTNGTVVWKDEVTASMKVSVLCRTYSADLRMAAKALASARAFFAGAIEYVAVVPAADLQEALAVLPEYVAVKPAVELQLSEPLLQQKMTLLYADLWCAGDYIYHLSSAAVLHRPALRRDFFIFNRPSVLFTRYTHTALTSAADTRRLALYQKGSGAALGQQVDFDFTARSDTRLFHRRVYQAAREHLERQHNTTVAGFLGSRQPLSRLQPQDDESRLFHALEYLSAFLFYRQPGLVSWTYTGADSPPVHAVPYEYAQIIPRLTCMADSELARLPAEAGREAEQSTQLQIMERIVNGQSPAAAPCGELEGYAAWVMSEVRRQRSGGSTKSAT